MYIGPHNYNKIIFWKGFGLLALVQLAQRGVGRDQAIHQNDRNP